MPLIPQTSTSNRRTCMLMVTHACNLNCTYCYERFKDAGMMSFETAKTCILKEVDFVRHSEKYNELEIDFMGGEPLLNFTLIQQVVEWLEETDIGIPYITFATSNGTLITEENKVWLEAHKDSFVIGLSYDGDELMQACNRNTQPIDLSWFARVWPFQGVRMTISKETVRTLARGVLSVQRAGLICTAVLAQGIDWDDEDARIFERELKKLAEIYLSDFSLRPIEPLLTRSLSMIGVDRPQPRFCGSGNGMVTYDLDGVVYPCHMFTPLVLGKNAAVTMDASELCNCDVVEDSHCVGCSYVSWCPTCYGFNYCYRGDIRKRDHAICRMIDVQVRVACDFQLNYYYRRVREISSEDATIVREAVRVARLFKDGKVHVNVNNK